MLKVPRLQESEDFVFRLICAVIAAHILVVFGVEVTFFEAILNPVYYKAMAGSVLIALPVVEYTGFISRRLDRRYDWLQAPFQRLLVQLLLGVFATATLTFLLASLYFYVRGVNVFQTEYLRLDFPLVVSLIVLLNVFFVLQYFYRYIKRNNIAPKAPDAATSPIQNMELLIARSGNQTVTLVMTEIAFFYLEDDNRYLQTFQGRKLLIGESLEELEARLDPIVFFRANRQVIISRKACRGFTVIEFGKLELTCDPPFPMSIIVSQRKAKEFRQWLAAKIEHVPVQS